MDLSDSFKILYSLILELTSAEDGLSTGEIVQRYGISRRLVPKYMDILTHAGIPIYTEHKRWYVLERFAAPFTLAPDESELLTLALESFRQQQPVHWQITARLMNKFTDRIPDSTAQQILQPLTAQTGTNSTESHFKLMAEAKTKQFAVWVDYRPLRRNQLSRWLVYPYRFTRNPHSDGLYLICDGTQNESELIGLTLKLDRIVGVSLTQTRFDMLSPAQIQTRIEQAWGIWQGESDVVELIFDAHHEQRLRESQWHPSQSLSTLPDGRIHYSAQVGDWREMIPWIRSWGSGVEVIAPLPLKQRIIASLERQMRRYKLVVSQDTSSPQSLLWAKYNPSDQEYHLLMYHLLDVAAVALMMWRYVLSASHLKWISDLFNLPENDAMHFMALLVGLHDIGKATADFQRKAPYLYQQLLEAGVDDCLNNNVPHGVSSKAVIEALLTAQFSMEKPTARRLAAAIGGHHGQWIHNRQRAARTSPAWEKLHQELFERLTVVLPISRKPSLSGEAVNVLAAFVSGFTSVCDWIGSDERFFPYLSAMQPAKDYWKWACDQAQTALGELGWYGWHAPGESHNFATVFDFQPNAFQQTVLSAINAQDRVPELVIIEYPTGGGKTEAALQIADDFVNHLGLAGVYVAMPTQATGNQMFTRFADYLARRYPADTIQVQLIHAQATSHPLYSSLPRSSERTGNEAGLVAEDWFQHRKRTLLSPMGVGTVDQAMLSVLQARHHFVRQYALSHKAIIFDEIHAYDTYMSTIIERLLRWLKALQSPVILLSATLPQQTRQALLAQYGIQREQLDDVAYPRMTVVTGDHVHVYPLPISERRSIEIRHIAGDVDTLVATTATIYQQGGCIAVLCNTVDEAIHIVRLLRALERIAEEDVYLFHARFPPAWRDGVEQDVLRLFGKAGERPNRAILVATQIVEQSLDLDFDVMISRTAPIDMLIQRVGRLHRHQRGRPEHLRQPMLLLRSPDFDAAGVPDFGVDAWVYEPAVLLRTWAIIRHREHLAVPDELELLIEAVYSDAPIPDLDEAYGVALQEAHQVFLSHQQRDTYRGGLGLIAEPDDDQLIGHTSLDLPDEVEDTSVRVATRDIKQGIDIVCLHEMDGVLSLSDEALILVNLNQRPSASDQQPLARMRLTLQNETVVRALEALPIPPAWGAVRALRNTRPIVFQNGLFEANGVLLRLSREYGLEIIRE